MQSHCSPRIRSLALVVVLLGAGSIGRTQTPNTAVAPDPYVQAVASYVDAASKETAAVRKEVVANEKIGKKDKFAPVREELEKCEALIARLRKAGPSQFDPLKLQYEKSRTALLEKLADARKP